MLFCKLLNRFETNHPWTCISFGSYNCQNEILISFASQLLNPVVQAIKTLLVSYIVANQRSVRVSVVETDNSTVPF